ncbi:Type I Iterative PKS [Arachnomyces sp. PD_36]|nr:Type I Iterative PKS [Arachnomyces sp. PD_36]
MESTDHTAPPASDIKRDAPNDHAVPTSNGSHQVPLAEVNGVATKDSGDSGTLKPNGYTHEPVTGAKCANRDDRGGNEIPTSYDVPSTDGLAGGNYDDAPPPIAIVGMAMRLPGGVSSAEDLWELLIEKKDGHCPVPDSRYSINAYDGPPGSRSKGPESGYFLREDPAYFDTEFFSINEMEAAKLDPQQRLLLEVVWECMENGGQTSWRGKDIGCYVGVFAEDWLEMMTKDVVHTDRHNVPARDFALSNRVSYEYDLKGPSATIKTACSSTLVGLHEACQAIYTGECSASIVAGTSLILTPTLSSALTEGMAISPDGISKTFDAAANGYGRGEAINAILIKKLDDATRDGDPIRAVIRSTAINCDGRSFTITSPNPQSQEQLIRRAYKKANLTDMSKTAFVECHGTGTKRGDTTEASVIARVFDKGVYIGGVKPNVGHSEGASGVTSIVKSVLALENKIIPPNVHFNNPNPKIPFKEANLQVPTEPTAWPDDRVERISVNSFGVGGANAHVIIDSAASFCPERLPNGTTCERDSRLLVLSAKSPGSLQRRIEGIQNYFDTHSAKLEDLAFTLGVKREHLTHRAFTVANKDYLKGGGGTFQVSGGHRFFGATFVFTGQGAQWSEMGKTLMASFENFLSDIRMLDEILQPLPEELSKPEATSRIDEPEYAQPLCTAVQIGIANLLAHWGVRPSSVVGHSSGEIAAAYVAGAITAKTAMAISYYRGQVMKQATNSGAMAAVGMSSDDVHPYLEDGVVAACENSLQSTTLSGDSDALDRTLERIKSDQPDVFHRRLRVGAAYHSHHMKKIGDSYQNLLDPIVGTNSSMIPMYSTVTGKVTSDPRQLQSKYWRQNLESPVLFRSAINQILSNTDKNHTFLEIGPHSALSGPLRHIFNEEDRKVKLEYIPTLLRGQDQETCLLMAAGRLHSCHLPIDLMAINGPGRILTDIPSYPWQHNKRYWYESRLTKEWRFRDFPDHELLGSRLPGSTDLEPSWRNILRLENIPWIWDHKVNMEIVFPGVGYIAIAGEAIRQVSKIPDYTIRNMFIKSPLVLKEASITEVITNLKPAKLTNSLDSAWYEFTISAYVNNSWFKCCIGLVGSGNQGEHSVREIQTFPRLLEKEVWYTTASNHGMAFGPSFQLLENISINPLKNEAAAAVEANEQNIKSQYTLHPLLLDQGFQLIAVAACQGLNHRVGKLGVPVSIEEIYVGDANRRISLGASTGKVNPEKQRVLKAGEAFAVSENALAFSMRGVVMVEMPTEEDEGTFSAPLASRIEWQPDVDFVEGKGLISPAITTVEPMDLLMKLVLLTAIELGNFLQDLDPDSDKPEKYETLVNSNVSRVQELYSMISGSDNVKAIELATREELFEELSDVAASSSPKVKPFGKFLRKALDALQDEISPMEFFMAEEGWKSLYEFAGTWSDWTRFLMLMGHSNPSMRVLEIGAGAGATTAAVVYAMYTQENVRQYSKYVFSDACRDRVTEAKETFSKNEGFEFEVLDINKNPLEQGFVEESYDLIIVSDLRRIAKDTTQALRNIRQLLVPGGRLLSRDLLPDVPAVDYLISMLPESQALTTAVAAGRIQISWEQREKELVTAGFLGVDADAYKFGYPWDMKIPSVARVPFTPVPKKKVNFLYGSSCERWCKTEKRLFRERGYEVEWCTLQDLPPPDEDVVAFLDLEGPFFDGISEEKYNAFIKFLSNAKGRTVWVTRPSQMSCENPRYGYIQGLARTIRYEVMLDFATFEIDNLDATAGKRVVDVYEKFVRQFETDYRDPEFEFALHQGTIHTSRFHWMPLEKHQFRSPEFNTPKKLEVVRPGDLDSFTWAEKHVGELGPDDVEVNITHVGLNFRDLMISLGLLTDIDECGFEACGMVCRVGSCDVNFNPGERVLVFSTGLFTTRKIVSSKSCLRLPDSISPEIGAALPIAYATAIHSLLNLGQLKKGQSVLIQSASGAVGQAAINVCQGFGAVIYATVGNEQKAQFLVSAFDIPRQNIFNSGDASFRSDIMRETGGRGVDIVLNSLSGELLHASWECVATFGKMIEIGKRDFLGQGMLRMDKFSSNRAFFGVDLLQILQESPEMFLSLRAQMNRALQRKKIKPIHPVKTFRAKDIQQAFRYMQARKHMGKIVVEMPSDTSELPATIKPNIVFSSEGTYLLTGGLGGIGRAISIWMVENGARHLTYLSRSAGSSTSDKTFIDSLEFQGCNVIAIAGSVANLDDVKRAVAASSRPIAGVIHLAMALRTGSLLNSSLEDWNVVQTPKVDGLWNLHNALSSEKLDFFVGFSSVASLCGNMGQANYAAANSFVDAFVKYRSSQGLPASVINLGAVGDVGCIAQAPDYLKAARSASLRLLNEKEVIDSVEAAIRTPNASSPIVLPAERTRTIAGMSSSKPLSDPNVRCLWAKDARYSYYAHIEPKSGEAAKSSSTADELRKLLSEVEKYPEKLDEPHAEDIILKALAFRLNPPQTGELDVAEIASMVVDSLMLVEINGWLRRNLGLELGMADVANAGTAGALAKLALKTLRAKYTVDN